MNKKYHDSISVLELALDYGSATKWSDTSLPRPERDETISHILETLLDNGTVVEDESNIMDLISRSHFYKCLKLMLDKGVDVNTAIDDEGNTLLHGAVRAEDVDMVTILLEHDAEIEIKNQKGVTPVDLARKVGNPKMLATIEEKLYGK